MTDSLPPAESVTTDLTGIIASYTQLSYGRMTKAEALRVLVASLADDDDDPKDPAEIATILSIPVARVDAILDSLDTDAPAWEYEPTPILEPLGGPAVITSQIPVADSLVHRSKKPRKAGPKNVGGRPKATDDVCGTSTGYWRHRNRKEKCDRCRQAYNAERAAKKREAS